MAEEKKILIPGRLKNAAVGGHVAGTEDIYDDVLGRTQNEINSDIREELSEEIQRAQIKDREQDNNIESLNQQVAFEGNLQVANTSAEITDDGGKVPSVGAVSGALKGVGYFECNTAASTVNKTIAATGYSLRAGGCIKIKMINANTANNATLTVGSTAAKPLFYGDERTSAGNTWEAGEVVEVYYDPSYNSNTGAFYANNVAGGSGDGAFDISKYKAVNGTPATYRTLAEALGTNGANVPSNKRKGGMTIKYIHLTDATYNLVKTEGLETQPTGTELQEAISIADGTYTAAQLPQNIVLPQTIGASTTYYLAVTETVDEQEVTTYTMWVVTKLTNDITEYVQWMLKNTTWSIVQSDWVGKDETPTEGSTNWVTSGGVYDVTTLGNNVEIDLTQYTAVRAYPNPEIWVVSSAAYPYYGMFIPVKAGQKYLITANSEAYTTYGFLTTNTYRHNANVSYATGCTRMLVPAGETVIDTAPSDAKYIWIGTYTTYDITPESFAEYHKMSVKDYLNNTDATPTEDSVNLVTSGGVYNAIASIDSSIFDASHAVVSTTTLTLTCNHSSGAATYKQSYNFAIGKNYRITLSVDSAASEILQLVDLPKSEYIPWIEVMSLPVGSLTNTFMYTPSRVNGYLQVYCGTTASNGKAVTAVIEEFGTLQDVNDALLSALLSAKTEINTNSGDIAKIEDQVFYESGMTYKSYTGNRITPNRIGFKAVGSLVTGQSAAVFGDVVFAFGNGATTCIAYNMKTRTLIKNPVYINGAPSKSSSTAWHCNSSEFGTNYYAEGDAFPLLYIGGSQDDAIHELLVCRVMPDASRVYHLDVVQVLTMPNEWGYANVAFDEERGKIILCNTDRMMFKVCNPPAVVDGEGNPISTYTFTEEDVEQTITIDASSLPVPQDAAMHRGLLYLGNGHGIRDNAFFRVIDLYNGTLVNDVSITGWFTDSAEGYSFYNEHMYIFGSANIYKIWFM